MMHNFTASPPNRIGFYSPNSAAVNFCEIDYETTNFIAEFINTLSNVAYIYFSAAVLSPGLSRWNVFSWPPVNIALLLIGIGSAAFHATLQHGAQMADELSMYAIITTLNYRVYTYNLFSSLFAKRAVALMLVASTAIVAYSNITASKGASFDLHLVFFVALCTAFWPRVLYLIYHDAKKSSAETSEHSRARRMGLFGQGGRAILLGFVLWVIDGVCCQQLRAIRSMIGLPFAWLLKLHGAWHVLTAIGAAMFVRLVDDLTNEHLKSH